MLYLELELISLISLFGFVGYALTYYYASIESYNKAKHICLTVSNLFLFSVCHLLPEEANLTWGITLPVFSTLMFYSYDKSASQNTAFFWMGTSTALMILNNFVSYPSIEEFQINIDFVRYIGNTLLAAYSLGLFRLWIMNHEVQKKTYSESHEHLINSQKEFKSLFENAPMGIIIIDKNRQYIEVNKSFQDFVGYTRDELLTMTVFDLTHPDELLDSQNISTKLMKKEFFLKRKRKKYLHKNGHIIWGELTSRWLDDSGENVLSIIEDITEIVRLEEEFKNQQVQILQASKMSALGEMSSGIAHEINNPITVILGKVDRLRSEISDSALSIQEKKSIFFKIDSIQKMSERITKIIRGLRSFARDADKDPLEKINVKNLLEETLAFCQEKFQNQSIQLKINDFPENLAIDCRGPQISQVILNLLSNSIDAISEMHDKWIEINVFEINRNVTIEIIDSGLEIPLEFRNKIMQPFFTTKEVGKGTGLGLSISIGIIKSHGGNLVLDDKCPHTKFIITLPKSSIDLHKSA